MSSAAPRQPSDGEAIEILRRLEPMLSAVRADQHAQAQALAALGDAFAKQGEAITKQGEVITKHGEAITQLGDAIAKQGEAIVKLREDVVRIDGRLAGIDGRIAGIEGQLRLLPTVWTLTGLIIAIFGCAFALLRFGVPRP